MVAGRKVFMKILIIIVKDNILHYKTTVSNVIPIMINFRSSKINNWRYINNQRMIRVLFDINVVSNRKARRASY